MPSGQIVPCSQKISNLWTAATVKNCFQQFFLFIKYFKFYGWQLNFVASDTGKQLLDFTAIVEDFHILSSA